MIELIVLLLCICGFLIWLHPINAAAMFISTGLSVGGFILLFGCIILIGWSILKVLNLILRR